jgi:CheY-like chemotaxis protein
VTSPTTKKPTILVVEDHEDSRQMMQTLLELDGFAVFSATTGFEAIAQARALEPDLILMDINLPGIDGINATKVIRREFGSRPLQIIALTAYGMDETRAAALAAGCDELMLKPVDFERLEATVIRLLGAANGPAATAPVAHTRKPASASKSAPKASWSRPTEPLRRQDQVTHRRTERH